MMSLRTSRQQRDRFYDEVKVGDVFCCSISSVTDSGMDVALLCYACRINREIDHLKVVVRSSQLLIGVVALLLYSTVSLFVQSVLEFCIMAYALNRE